MRSRRWGSPASMEKGATSGRLIPVVAFPMATPSTCTTTDPMAVPGAVILSMAHPDTVTVPEIEEPGVGPSITTLGVAPDCAARRLTGQDQTLVKL